LKLSAVHYRISFYWLPRTLYDLSVKLCETVFSFGKGVAEKLDPKELFHPATLEQARI
jgi:hypothetical protein